MDALFLLEFSTGLALWAQAMPQEQASLRGVTICADGIHVGVAFGFLQGRRHTRPIKAEEQAEGQQGPPPALAPLPRQLRTPRDP